MPLSTYPSLPATSSLMTKPLPPSAAVDLTQVFKTLMGKALHLLVSGEKPWDHIPPRSSVSSWKCLNALLSRPTLPRTCWSRVPGVLRGIIRWRERCHNKCGSGKRLFLFCKGRCIFEKMPILVLFAGDNNGGGERLLTWRHGGNFVYVDRIWTGEGRHVW